MKSKLNILTLITILLIALTACTSTNTTSPKGIILPDLSGKTIQNYAEVINSPKITIVTATEHHETIPVDQFIRYGRGLNVGDQVNYGEMLYIYFSKGPQKVADTEKPQILGALNIEVPYASDFDPRLGVTVTDNVDNDLLNRLIVTGNVNTWDLSFSTQSLLYSVMDRAGNLTQVTREVKIIPNSIDTRYTDDLVLDRDYIGKSYTNDGIGMVTFHGCIDGDTAYFKSNGQTLYVRFLGIDTPETKTTVDPWGKAASDYTCNVLQNAGIIVLEHEGELYDSYGRYLAWIWVDGRLLNLEIVENAYSAAKGSSTSKYYEIFNLADLKTQGTKRRIWGELDPNYNYN